MSNLCPLEKAIKNLHLRYINLHLRITLSLIEVNGKRDLESIFKIYKSTFKSSITLSQMHVN